MRVQMLLFCTHVCTVPHCSCGTGAPGGHPVAHRDLLKCPLQEPFCSVFGDSLFLGIRDGTNSAAQADFASGSDNLITVCCPWHGGAIWPCYASRAVILRCLEFQLLLMRSWAVLEWQQRQLGASLWQMEPLQSPP